MDSTYLGLGAYNQEEARIRSEQKTRINVSTLRRPYQAMPRLKAPTQASRESYGIRITTLSVWVVSYTNSEDRIFPRRISTF